MKPLPSVGQLIDQSWEFYRRHFFALMSISGWYCLVILVSVLIAIYYPDVSTILSTAKPFTAGETGTVIAALIQQLLFNPIVSLWVAGALMLFIQKTLVGKTPAPNACLKKAWRNIWPLFYTGLQFALLCIGAVAVCLAPGVLFLWLDNQFHIPATALLGSLLFLIGIPAALAWVIKLNIDYLFLPFIVVLTNKRGRTAFQTSKALIHPVWMPVLIRIAVPSLVVIIVSMLLLILASMIAGVMINTISGFNMDVFARLSNINRAVLPSLALIFSYPLVLTIQMMVFEELDGRDGI